jgi:DNA-damage-inducible protein J
MAKTAMIRARTEAKTKERAEKVIRALGLTPTAAITMFYHQIIRQGGLPFQPNATTLEAMRETARGENVERAESVEELMGEFAPGDK